MDAERAPGGASLEQAEVVRSRLASFGRPSACSGPLTGSFLGLCVKPCALENMTDLHWLAELGHLSV